MPGALGMLNGRVGVVTKGSCSVALLLIIITHFLNQCFHHKMDKHDLHSNAFRFIHYKMYEFDVK